MSCALALGNWDYLQFMPGAAGRGCYTSALDPATEVEIMNTIDRISKQRTVIMITHRIAHALRADKMFVLENGSIVVSG